MNSSNPDNFLLAPAKGMGWHERAFAPTRALEFLAKEEEDQVEWVLEDYLPTGGLVLLAAKSKVGKTTLVYQLAVKIARGGEFLNRQTAKSGVLLLALEEHPRDVRLRLRSLGADGENIHIHTGRLTPSCTTFEAITKYLTEQDIKLIVVDTLGMFWRVREENDSGEVTQEIVPLLALARDTGACVLLIHHFRKSDGDNGDEIRGSDALLASVDVALLLYRGGSENQRKLRTVGRYADTPAELIIALENGEYSVVTDPTSGDQNAERERLMFALSVIPEGIEALANKAQVPKKRAYRHLKTLASNGKAQTHRKGVKGDPLRYSLMLDEALSSSLPSLARGRERESRSDESEVQGCSGKPVQSTDIPTIDEKAA